MHNAAGQIRCFEHWHICLPHNANAKPKQAKEPIVVNKINSIEMTKHQQKILKQATGINFFHGGLANSMNYILLDFDDPKEILAEYRDLATLFERERWRLLIEAILVDGLRISFVMESEKEKVTIGKLAFNENELKYFLRNVPSESIVGLSVGKDQIKMTDHFRFVANLQGYSTSVGLELQLQ